MRVLILVVVLVGLGVVALTDVPAAYVFAPLLGLVIFRVGMSSFGSLRAGAKHVPDGPPQPVDTTAERTVFWCTGCGAELLLLVRGTDMAPRHCGERMTERREVPATPGDAG